MIGISAGVTVIRVANFAKKNLDAEATSPKSNSKKTDVLPLVFSKDQLAVQFAKFARHLSIFSDIFIPIKGNS